MAPQYHRSKKAAEQFAYDGNQDSLESQALRAIKHEVLSSDPAGPSQVGDVPRSHTTRQTLLLQGLVQTH